MSEIEAVNAMMAIEEQIRTIEEKHREEIQPFKEQLKEVSKTLGEIRSGFSIGDIIVNDKGKLAKVTNLRRWCDEWEGNAINIRKDGSEGGSRAIFTWQHWRKK